MSFYKDAQKFRAGNAQMSAVALAAPIVRMGQAELQAAVTDVLQAAFGQERNAEKKLATVANVNIKTARNWLRGSCTPGPLAQLRLMALVPEFQSLTRRLTAMHADMDPMFERQMHEAFQLFQQMQRQPFNAPPAE